MTEMWRFFRAKEAQAYSCLEDLSYEQWREQRTAKLNAEREQARLARLASDIELNQSLNQSLNRSLNEGLDRRINHYLNKSLNQSLDKRLNQLLNKSLNQGFKMDSMNAGFETGDNFEEEDDDIDIEGEFDKDIDWDESDFMTDPDGKNTDEETSQE